MKKFVVLLLVLPLAFACKKPAQPHSLGSGYVSPTYEMMVKHIQSMSASSWDKATYESLRNDINELLSRESERQSAISLLEAEYCKILVRDGKKVLDSGCSVNKTVAKSHEQLRSIMKEFDERQELKSLKDNNAIPGLKALEEQKRVHDNASNFMYRTRNSVNKKEELGKMKATYKSNYSSKKDDKYAEYAGYEQERIDKAKDWLKNKELKCKYVRKEIEKLTHVEAYVNRRVQFCQSVVKSYMECENPAFSEYDEARFKVELDYVSKDSIAVWQNSLKAHYDELNKPEEINEKEYEYENE